jgi:predicted dehydrogenase
MLNDPKVDAAVIATPISTHFPLPKLHCWPARMVWEKPMTGSIAEAVELAGLADERGLTLWPALSSSARCYKVKDIIDSGELGHIFRRVVTGQPGLYQRDVSVVWSRSGDLSIFHH